MILGQILWPLIGLLSAIAVVALTSFNMQPSVVILAAALGAWAAIATILQMRQQQLDIRDADRAIAQFIHGFLDARVPPVQKKNQWGIFKYRLNNLLDILDVTSRKQHAAIDENENADYIDKLKQTLLYNALIKAQPADVPAPAPQAATPQPLPQHTETLELTEEISQPDEPPEPDEDDAATDNNDSGGLDITDTINALLEKLAQDLECATSSLEFTEDTDAVVSRIETRHAAERAQKNVSTVATAAEQLSASIQEIAARVLESSNIAEEAVGYARRGNMVIYQLNEASTKIGDVVDLINDIAGQTNLLALNATIEAARAGEAGKGFSVVASEVKDLAEQTSQATDEIALQVNNIQNATKQTIDTIRQISKTITTMSEIATMISSAVEQQSAATGEISRNIQQAAKETSVVATQHGNEANSKQKIETIQEHLQSLNLGLSALRTSLTNTAHDEAA